MHSDDFTYYDMGLSFYAHYKHYLGWSGRFVIDYIAAALLSINQHGVIVGINSLAFVALIYTVSTLPIYDSLSKSRNTVYFILFACFWLGNPDLGQTTFWVVGAVNYLWPCLFCVLFIKYFLKIFCNQESDLKKYDFYACVVFAILTGASNEVMSVTLSAVLGCVTLYAYCKKYRRLQASICLLLILLGSALVILSPGNFARLQLLISRYSMIADWAQLNLFEKFAYHMQGRVLDILNGFREFIGIYMIFFVLTLLLFFRADRRDRLLLLIFLSASMLATLALFAAPITPSRSYLTSMFFLWLSFSVCLKIVFQHGYGAVATTVRMVFVLLLVFFIPSYLLQLRAYYHAYQQMQVRTDLVQQAVAAKQLEANVPDYFFLKFLGRNREFDTFHNAGSMGKYYNLQAVNIYTVPFDYAVIRQPCDQKLSLPALGEGSFCIWSYRRNLIRMSVRTFVIEIPFEHLKTMDSNLDKVFYINMVEEKNKKVVAAPVEVAKIGKRVFWIINGKFSDIAENSRFHVTGSERR